MFENRVARIIDITGKDKQYKHKDCLIGARVRIIDITRKDYLQPVERIWWKGAVEIIGKCECKISSLKDHNYNWLDFNKGVRLRILPAEEKKKSTFKTNFGIDYNGVYVNGIPPNKIKGPAEIKQEVEDEFILTDLGNINEFITRVKNKKKENKNAVLSSLSEVDRKSIGDALQRSAPIISFGKYQGVSIAKVPTDYYIWLLSQEWFKSHKLFGQVIDEMRNRGIAVNIKMDITPGKKTKAQLEAEQKEIERIIKEKERFLDF